jgi:hypothetical protein
VTAGAIIDAMAASHEERIGVLVLRAWLEPGAEPRLRVRITHSLNVGRQEPTVAAAATVEETEDIVRAWLIAFLVSD